MEKFKSLLALDSEVEVSTDKAWVATRAKLNLGQISAKLVECGADHKAVDVAQLGLEGLELSYCQVCLCLRRTWMLLCD